MNDKKTGLAADRELALKQELSARSAMVWLLILMVLAFLVRLRVGFYQGLNFDGCGYVMHGWSIAAGHLTTPYWAKGLDHYYPPLYPALIALGQVFTRDWVWAAKIVNHLLGALLLIPCYLIGARLYGRTGGIVAAALLVSSPLLVELGSNGASEPAFLLAFAFGLYFFDRLLREKKMRAALFAGLCFGLAYLARTQAIMFPLIALTVLAWEALRKNIRPAQGLAGLALILVGFYLFALPYDLYCLKKDGVYGLRARQEFFKKVTQPDTASWYIAERDLNRNADMLLNFEQAKDFSPLRWVAAHPGEYFRAVSSRFRQMAALSFQWGTIFSPLLLVLLFCSALALIFPKRKTRHAWLLNPVWVIFPALLVPLAAPALVRYYAVIVPLLALYAALGALFLREAASKIPGLNWLRSPRALALWVLPLLLLFPHGKLLYLASRAAMEQRESERVRMAKWVSSSVTGRGKIIMSEDAFAAMTSGNYWFLFPMDFPARVIAYAQAQGADYLLVEEHLLTWMEAPLEWTDYFLTPEDKPGLKLVSSYPEGEEFPTAALYRVEQPEPKPAASANVILVVIGSLRPDRLSGYGYSQKTSPFLDWLSQSGIRFENVLTASAQSDWSMVSLLTSTWLEGPLALGQKSGDAIKPRLETLADLLKRSGYQTAAFADFGKETGAFEKIPLTGFDQSQTPQPELILSWLDQRDPHRPWFIFLDIPETAASAYDDHIRYADRMLEIIFWNLAKKHLFLPKTLVIITSDRGVELGERGGALPSRLYDEVIKVPLILSWPGQLPAGKVVHNQVRTIDVLPTIFDLLGLPIPAQAQGVSLKNILDSKVELSALSESIGETGLEQSLRTPEWFFRRRGNETLMFDLVSDPAEKSNLLGQPAREETEHLHRVQELMAEGIDHYNLYNLRHLKKFSPDHSAR